MALLEGKWEVGVTKASRKLNFRFWVTDWFLALLKNCQWVQAVFLLVRHCGSPFANTEMFNAPGCHKGFTYLYTIERLQRGNTWSFGENDVELLHTNKYSTHSFHNLIPQTFKVGLLWFEISVTGSHTSLNLLDSHTYNTLSFNIVSLPSAPVA